MSLLSPTELNTVEFAESPNEISNNRDIISSPSSEFNEFNDNGSNIKKLKKKVLIIGLDGTRVDCLNSTVCPFINSLFSVNNDDSHSNNNNNNNNSDYIFSTKSGITGDICWSGPGWTSLFTGVWREKHRINGNDNILVPVCYPTLFSRLKSLSDNSIKSASIVNWEPLNSNIIQQIDYNYVFADNDKTITAEAIKILSDNNNNKNESKEEINPDITFIHLDDIDHAGHEFDYCSSQYLDAIKITDQRVKSIIDTVKSRINYLNEDWLIILTTDHGGYNFTHELPIPENRTIFIILLNLLGSQSNTDTNNIKKYGSNQIVGIVDIYPTVIKHFGFNILDDWNLDGKSLI